MTPLRHDVVVIGGGPAGLLAARESASDGAGVVVFEEHMRVGEPDHCAGLLSVTGLRSLGLSPPPEVVQNRVSGARIISPSGHTVVLRRGREEALVVDRRKFDRWLATRAEEMGVTVCTGTKVTALLKEGDRTTGVRVRTGDTVEEHHAEYVIDAEGVRGVISKAAGLPRVAQRNRFPAYQYEMSGVQVEEDTVEMFYSRKYAPGFFAWIIPIGEGRVRVGLAARNRAPLRLRAAVRHHPVMRKRLEDGVVHRRLGGTVIVGPPISRTHMPGLMVVGDAAGQVKATTGGGVIMGGLAALMAGRAVRYALGRMDECVDAARLYEEQWRGRLLNELGTMYLAQRLVAALSDRGLDSLVNDASRYGLVSVVTERGDMDHQHRAIWGVLSRPQAVLAILRAIRYVHPFF